MSEKTLRIRVYGIVQGVGFRPFVSRIADANNIVGSVCNKGPYVEIIAHGDNHDVALFQHELEHHPPERAAILKIDYEDYLEAIESPDFKIITSAKEKGDIFVSPDIAICPKCKEELFDQSNRRYLHPFINCTACGPRLTILDSMPYDRERTSMGEFPMCDQCNYEYTHAETRRYDAQPVCCNDCGPEVYIIGTTLRKAAAITETRKTIASGGIVAIKGIGGFHLCCDATNEKAVSQLRKAKKRPVKPFAVMMKDLKTATRECAVEDEEKEILDGHQKPIILLEKKKGHVCQAVAPGNPKIGVMLPYTPLHLLLFTYDDTIIMPDCLVMTSANESGAPICRTDEDAIHELSQMCDCILSHNRKIRLRADDSVMDFYEHKPYMIRRSRGYAPLPFMVSENWQGSVLGIGGELKNTFCIGKNNLFYPSPYIGDMADLRTVKALTESITRMSTLLETKPTVVTCDMHPLYNTTVVAKEMGIPVIAVQHHYAHILSCMAENECMDPVIGVAFDGTGYGLDHTIWGGEFLIADFHHFERIGAIRPFQQRGGDISAKEGWRIAVSMLYALIHDKEHTANIIQQLQLCDELSLKGQLFMADHHINSIGSTSAGRLFDAVSAILGICRSSTFEGEASMALEFRAESWAKEHPLDVSKQPDWHDELAANPDGLFILPTDRLVMSLATEFLQSHDAGKLAYQFHDVLGELILLGCRKARQKAKINTVALSGGVFQNRLLLSLCDHKLKHDGFTVLKHSMIPTNDGGISLGQAVYAMNLINEKER